MLRGPFWGSRATAGRPDTSHLKQKGTDAWQAGDPGSPTSEDHASSSTTAWHVLGDTWQEPDAASSPAASSSTAAASTHKGSRAPGVAHKQPSKQAPARNGWLPGGSWLSAAALLGAVCCVAAALMGSGMVLGTLVGWVYVPPSLTLSRPLQLDFSGPKGAAAALLPLVRPLPRPSSFLPWRSQPSSSSLLLSPDEEGGDTGDLTYNQFTDTETWDALQPDPWQPPPPLLPAPPRPPTQQQLLGSGNAGPLLPRNPLRRWRRRRQGAGGSRPRPPSRLLSTYSSFGRGGALAPEAVPADAPPGMTWLLPAGAAVGVGLEMEVSAESGGRGMYQVVAELLDSDGGVLGRGVATHQPRRTSWLRRFTLGALTLPWDLLGLSPDTTTTSFTLFPRYREGGLLPGEVPPEAPEVGPPQPGGHQATGPAAQLRKPHAAWLRVKLVGRGPGGAPGLPQVFGARVTFRLQPGLLGWLAAQVRPGLLSGALLLALGAALVGGGTAGAALLLGASYLAASTAAEARSAQQEAAAPTPGAAHSAGQQAGQGSVASSSSNRGPVAGTAAWLHHKLGNGSEVEGSSGGSSTPATPQQQQEQPSQLAGGALGKGAWAGTPAGAPRAGGDEDAEQDEGGGSSDLISSIITGRTSPPGTPASSQPGAGGSSPGTSRWFDPQPAPAASSTSSSGVQGRGVGAIAALVEAEGVGQQPAATDSARSAEGPVAGQVRSDSASASETLLGSSPQKAEMRPVTKRLGFSFRP